MNKSASPARLWPERPYLGLDYFREKDAPLFFERSQDVVDCAELLLGFGVKILILQGSSGAGKSSFLHAGFNPYLRRDPERLVHFLGAGDDIVIRCTFDPLKWIGQGFLAAIENKRFPFGDGQHSAARYLDEERLARAREQLSEAAFNGPRAGLADAILEALELVCGDLPGKLVLVLDQAEEVLTQVDSDLNHANADSGFFYFLEEAYIRDIDVRIVVALRTEYYGRFRDELNIRDDRLGGRPRSGGVAPYLLRPIRDREALIHIAVAPSLGDAHAIYNYEFAPGAAERIVDDLLARLRHGSVTPLLQLICAVLYDELGDTDRTISIDTYEKRGGIDGIAKLYADRGFASALGEVPSHVLDRWYTLLHSLVSRQGGGTVVSEIETLEGMQQRAAEFGIGGDVGPALVKLCSGRSPLLRGQPADNPVQFSLRHDVLAVIFYRWKIANEARIKEQEEAEQRLREKQEEAEKLLQAEHEEAERRLAAMQRANAEAKARQRQNMMAGAFLLVLATAAFWYAVHQRSEFERLIERRIELANDPPRSDFGYSLLSLVGNLDATSHDDRVGALRNLVTKPFPQAALREKSIAALRETLNRTPWLTGEYLGAGLNPEGDAVLLLQSDGIVKKLSLGAGQPSVRNFLLPINVRNALDPKLSAPVGFLDGLGPATVIADTLYFWPAEAEEAWAASIKEYLPGSMAKRVGALRHEFVGGALQITVPARGAADNDRIRLFALRLTGPDFLSSPDKEKRTAEVAAIEGETPPPIFAEYGGSRVFGYVSRGVVRDPGLLRAAPGKKIKPGDGYYGLTMGELGGDQSTTVMLESQRRLPRSRYLPYTVTFVSNDRSILIGGPGTDFSWTRLGPDGNGTAVAARWPPAKIAVTNPQADPQSPTGAADARTPSLARIDAYSPWAYAPLAAVKLGDRLRFAWPAQGGIRAAETRPGQKQSLIADPLPWIKGPLLTGDPGGSKLRFSANGDFLLLQQQPQVGRPVRVRIWNFSQGRRDQIQKAQAGELRDLACEVVRSYQQSLKDAESVVRLFEFPGVAPKRC